MSDAGSLLVVVCAIYLSECCQWLRVDAVLIFNPWLRSWRVKYPQGVFGNEQHRLVASSMSPPLGPAYVTQWWPISISPEAIFSFSLQAVNPQGSPSYTRQWLPVAKIRGVAVRGSELIINGECFAKLCSPQLAKFFARLVRKLESSDASQRASVIDRALDYALASRSVQRRHRVTSRRTKLLWLLCNILCVYLVAISALLYYSSSARQLWPYWLMGLLFLLAQTIWEFRSVSRKLHRRDPKLWRSHGLMMFLSPLGAIRAYDIASRHALSAFHPLAVAELLCCQKISKQVARQALLDLKYPLLSSEEELTEQQAATVSWFQEHLESAVQRFFTRTGISSDELLAPPNSEGADSVSYCPRCHTQFVLVEGVCEPCQEIRLRPFAVSRN